MAKKKKVSRTMDPILQAMVQERLIGDELIQSCHFRGEDAVSVMLISKELHEMCRPSVKRFGRGGGSGRVLGFRLKDGQWEFVGTGGWIS